MKRYQSRIKQFHQNRLFHTDQSRLFEELNGKERSDLKPDGEQTKKCWSEIWSKPSQHNRNAEWLNNLKEEISVEKQEPVKVSIDKVRKVLKRMPNWKAPGPDLPDRAGGSGRIAVMVLIAVRSGMSCRLGAACAGAAGSASASESGFVSCYSLLFHF